MRENSLPRHVVFWQHCLCLIVSVTVFFIQGPRYVLHLWDRLPEGGDSFINSWILSWNAHAWSNPGISVWDAPIFFPVKNALAFSEAMFGNLWLTLPVQYLTDNPVFASNMLLLASFVLSAFCVYLLVYDLTRNFWASLIAGLVFSFNPYRWGHAGHLQLLPIFWSALAIMFTNRFLTQPTKKSFWGMLISVWIQYYASVYLGTMLLVFLILLFATNIIVERKGSEKWFYFTNARMRVLLLCGFVLSLIVLLPLGLPYMTTAKTWNFFRSLNENSAFSAELLSFFLRPSWGFANYDWLHKILEGSIKAGEGSVFLGLTPWLMLIMGIVALIGKKNSYGAAEIKFVRRYVWVAMAAGLLMLGPYLIIFNKNTEIPLLYQIVYYLIPGAKALRVPARFVQLFLLCMTIIGSFGIVVYFDISKRWPRLLKALPVLIFFLIFIFDYAVRSTDGAIAETKEEFPTVYKYLSQDNRRGSILELPVGRAGPLPSWNAFKYLHYQSAHWRPVLGGMSGWYPPGRLILSDKLDGSISSEAFELINLTPATTLVVHLNEYSKRDRAVWQTADLSSFGFEFAGKFDDALVWERGRDSPLVSDRLSILWAYGRIKKGKLQITVFLEPEKNGRSWRFLERSQSEIAVQIMAADKKNDNYEVSVPVPPYLLSGKHARIELPKVKLREKEIEKIRITGSLFRDYTLIDEPAGTPHVFKMSNGKFMSARNSGELGLVKRRGHEIGENDVFRLIRLGDNHIALIASNGYVVSAENGGDGRLVANRKIIDEWEIFAAEDLGNGRIALRTATGKYVSAKGDRVKAIGRTIGAEESFRLKASSEMTELGS